MKIKCSQFACKTNIELSKQEESYYNYFIKAGFKISKLCPYHSTLTKHTYALSDKWLKENNLECRSGIDSYNTILKICTGSIYHGPEIHTKALDDLPLIRNEAKRLTEKELKRS